MSALLDSRTLQSLDAAVMTRRIKARADGEHSRAYLRYIRDGREAGWSYKRIGEAWGVTDNAVRRYWKDHRMEATRLGASDA